MAKGDMVLKVGPTRELEVILDDVVTLIKSLDERLRKMEAPKEKDDGTIKLRD